MEYREDIEQLVKNSFDTFEPEVHPDVWTNIQNGLNASAASTSGSATNTVSTGAKLAMVSSKFSVMGLIGVTSAIIGITAAIIYFSTDNQTPNLKPEKEANNIQNVTPVSQDSKVESKIIPQTDNLKKEEQPVFAAGPLKTETDNVHLQDEHAAPSNVNNAVSKTENKETVVSNIEKKNVTGIADHKNEPADVKHADNATPAAAASANSTEKSDENKLSGDETEEQAQHSESKSATPSKDDEKPIEYYLGHISNVITPNADGNNDVFVIEGKELHNLKVIIYDRSGKIAHQWNNLHGFWDGKLNNGQPAGAGEYFYDIFAQKNNGNPLTKKGSLHLLLK
ncbi:MAG: gliding motility-associated C-terminal domain-containing protein [Bacteroidia bacterium]